MLQGVPDYFEVISDPMDLGTVRATLEAGLYRGWSSFIADARRVFANAITYNGSRDSEVRVASVATSDSGDPPLPFVHCLRVPLGSLTPSLFGAPDFRPHGLVPRGHTHTSRYPGTWSPSQVCVAGALCPSS